MSSASTRSTSPLAVGDRVVFENAGADTLAKAHMFNGIDLPTVYAMHSSGTLELKQHFRVLHFRGAMEGDDACTV